MTWPDRLRQRGNSARSTLTQGTGFLSRPQVAASALVWGRRSVTHSGGVGGRPPHQGFSKQRQLKLEIPGFLKTKGDAT
jgi:hypothetical protein